MDHHEVGEDWVDQEDRFEVGPESGLPVGMEVGGPGHSQVEVAAVLPEVDEPGAKPGVQGVDDAMLGKGDHFRQRHDDDNSATCTATITLEKGQKSDYGYCWCECHGCW